VSDAEFAIDIAASMPDGEQTSAELDALTAQLTGAGKDAMAFQRALQQVGGELDAASQAAKIANGALAEGRAEYAALEKEAARLARTLERQEQKGGATDEMRASAAAAAVAVDKYADELARLEREAKAADAAEGKLSSTHKKLGVLQRHVNDRLGDATTRLSTFRGALGDVGGPLGALGEKILFPAQAFVDLREQFGSSRAAAVVAAVGFVALSAAVALVTAAAVAAVASIAVLGVRLADTARAVGLTRAAFEAAHPALATVRGDIDALTDSTGLAPDRLRDLALSLTAARVSASELPAALRAAALAESALGQGGAAEYVAQLRAGSLTVRAFARDAEHAFGGIVAQQMLGLESQGARLKRNITGLFSGLDIEPLLAALPTLVDLFDSSTAAGRAVKAAFEGIFQPIIDHAQEALWVVEAFALGFLIAATRLYIGAKPYLDGLKRLLGFDDTSLADVLGAARAAGALLVPVLVSLGIGFGFVAVALGAIAALAVAPQLALVALLGALADAATAIVTFFQRAWGDVAKALGPERFAVLGEAIVDGMIAGLLGGNVALAGAVRGLATSAISAAKKALGIASPSKVFAEIGGYTAEGFAAGVDAEAPAARQAVDELTSAPATPIAFRSASPAPGAPSSAPGAAGQAPAASANFAGATFNFYGVADATSARGLFEEMLTRVLEGDAGSLAGAPA